MLHKNTRFHEIFTSKCSTAPISSSYTTWFSTFIFIEKSNVSLVQFTINILFGILNFFRTANNEKNLREITLIKKGFFLGTLPKMQSIHGYKSCRKPILIFVQWSVSMITLKLKIGSISRVV